MESVVHGNSLVKLIEGAAKLSFESLLNKSTWPGDNPRGLIIHLEILSESSARFPLGVFTSSY